MENSARLTLIAPSWVPPPVIQISPLPDLPRHLVSPRDSEPTGIFCPPPPPPFLNHLTSPRQRLLVLGHAPECHSGKPLTSVPLRPSQGAKNHFGDERRDVVKLNP
jgi:hypothetical protein